MHDLKLWFDTPAIKHIAATEFLAVIERCTRLEIKTTGIEVFRSDGMLLDVQIADDEKLGNA